MLETSIWVQRRIKPYRCTSRCRVFHFQGMVLLLAQDRLILCRFGACAYQNLLPLFRHSRTAQTGFPHHGRHGRTPVSGVQRAALVRRAAAATTATASDLYRRARGMTAAGRSIEQGPIPAADRVRRPINGLLARAKRLREARPPEHLGRPRVGAKPINSPSSKATPNGQASARTAPRAETAVKQHEQRQHRFQSESNYRPGAAQNPPVTTPPSLRWTGRQRPAATSAHDEVVSPGKKQQSSSVKARAGRASKPGGQLRAPLHACQAPGVGRFLVPPARRRYRAR